MSLPLSINQRLVLPQTEGTIDLHYPLVPLEELHDSISSGDVEAKSSIDMLVDHYIVSVL
jgi:hypothetical protein